MAQKIVYTLTVWITIDHEPEDPEPTAIDYRGIERMAIRALETQSARTADAEVNGHETVTVTTHYTGTLCRLAPHDRVTTIVSKVDCRQCLDALERRGLGRLTGGQS